MLVLTRKKGEILAIGEDIFISVVDVRGDSVRLGIEAPKSIPVWRKEVLDEIAEENRKALQGAPSAEMLRQLLEGEKKE
ncbi:MAG TPA: carbon storage regulator CsrA [Synergistaceae bacterium]|nr:carbon storage regulator CsrA [Synergistaceae bacterium]HPQ38522.1 carbon storage regulator CsrA [Synergistaceae bacterium]